MNGKPIPTVHGGPVRLIIPGYYGNMNVKWLTDLLLMDEPTPSAIMQKTYRMPIMPVEPGKFTTQDLTRQNSTPTYGFAIMNVLFAPLQGQKRSEEHKSEIHSLMRNSYDVFCLNKQTHN